MKAVELREKSVVDLQSLRVDLLKEQFNLRMQKATQQARKTHLVNQVRRNLARIETILSEKTGAR